MGEKVGMRKKKKDNRRIKGSISNDNDKGNRMRRELGKIGEKKERG